MNSEIEKRQYTAWNKVPAFGRANFQLECPFCETVVTAYIWSLAGGGKRCPTCNSLHTGFGLTYADEKAKRDKFTK